MALLQTSYLPFLTSIFSAYGFVVVGQKIIKISIFLKHHKVVISEVCIAVLQSKLTLVFCGIVDELVASDVRYFNNTYTVSL